MADPWIAEVACYLVHPSYFVAKSMYSFHSSPWEANVHEESFMDVISPDVRGTLAFEYRGLGDISPEVIIRFQ
jgi:hypothetical protein